MTCLFSFTKYLFDNEENVFALANGNSGYTWHWLQTKLAEGTFILIRFPGSVIHYPSLPICTFTDTRLDENGTWSGSLHILKPGAIISPQLIDGQKMFIHITHCQRSVFKISVSN